MTSTNIRPQICIIDDNRIARRILAEHLSSERYDLHLLASGKELLARFNSLNPDVVLLDVMMPEMNGFEVCQHLKQKSEWQHIPVILVTALDSKDALVLGVEAGADEFLSKPVIGHEIRSRVRSMLRIKKLYDELQATLKLREDLADMITSDMKTSLNIITIHNDLMLYRHKQEPKALASIRAIQTQLRYLDSFVDELLLTTKLDEGGLLLSPAPIDVNQQVQRLVRHYENLAEAKDIIFIVDLPEESMVASLDTALFDGILNNLLSYAFKVSSIENTVALQVRYLGKQNGSRLENPTVHIQVIDEGSNIPQAEWDSVSDGFKLVTLKQEITSRLDPSLIFCKLAVKAHGGQICVMANKPRGNILTVEI